MLPKVTDAAIFDKVDVTAAASHAAQSFGITSGAECWTYTYVIPSRPWFEVK
jgi:hypothetical protein